MKEIYVFIIYQMFDAPHLYESNCIYRLLPLGLFENLMKSVYPALEKNMYVLDMTKCSVHFGECIDHLRPH